MTEHKLTGTLRNAFRGPRWPGAEKDSLNGDIYGDANGRFRDGENVSTNYIVEDLGGDTFLTQSGSVYKVESWRVKP